MMSLRWPELEAAYMSDMNLVSRKLCRRILKIQSALLQRAEKQENSVTAT